MGSGRGKWDSLYKTLCLHSHKVLTSVQMKNGLRHWGRNFLDYLEGYFLHEQREVSVVEAMLVTAHCLLSFSGCLFGNFVFAEACSHSSNEAK